MFVAGALDAESETLVNQALNQVLRDKITTISIAHRLSTIKRSDRILCLGPDGRVADEGSYAELAARPDGAFTKLMEWQMSGGDVVSDDHARTAPSSAAAEKASERGDEGASERES